jgi:hypothetical protein
VHGYCTSISSTGRGCWLTSSNVEIKVALATLVVLFSAVSYILIRYDRSSSYLRRSATFPEVGPDTGTLG